MKFFVDTAEIDAIAELNDLGMVDGVTTNPSLILKSGRDILEVTKEIWRPGRRAGIRRSGRNRGRRHDRPKAASWPRSPPISP